MDDTTPHHEPDGEPRTHGERDRPRRAGGRLAGWWGSAMSAGTSPTREHRVVDATARPPGDDTDPLGWDPGDASTWFDDDADAWPHDDDATWLDADPSTWFDEVGAAARAGRDLDDEHHGADDRVAVAAAGPVPWRRPPRGAHGPDPMVRRLGLAAVAATLILPLLLALGSGDGGDDLVESAAATAPAVERDVPTTSAAPTTIAPVTPAPSTATTAPTTTAAPTTVAPTTAAPTTATPTTEADAADGASLVSDELNEAPSETTAAPTTATPTTAAPTTAAPATTAPATTEAPADRAAACARTYEVAAGDYWIRVADAAGVSLADLLAANGATADTAIYPGMAVCLPEGASMPAPPPATTAAPTTAAPTTAAPTTAAPTTAAPTTAAPTTAAPTTAAPTTAPPRPAGGEARMQQIIRDVWPDSLEDRAIEIAHRESRFDPYAKNYCCYGLFQMYWEVHRGWLADLGITSAEQLYDPVANARAAYALYQRAGGWGPWGF